MRSSLYKFSLFFFHNFSSVGHKAASQENFIDGSLYFYPLKRGIIHILFLCPGSDDIFTLWIKHSDIRIASFDDTAFLWIKSVKLRRVL